MSDTTFTLEFSHILQEHILVPSAAETQSNIMFIITFHYIYINMFLYVIIRARVCV